MIDFDIIRTVNNGKTHSLFIIKKRVKKERDNMLINIVVLVVGFVIGILVGRRNKQTVETVVSTVKEEANKITSGKI